MASVQRARLKLMSALSDVEYRDVVVLGKLNERFFVFNLTDNDLSDPANSAFLKNQLLDAANTASDEL